MNNPCFDPEREKRIAMEIIANTDTTEEQAMGWYYYMKAYLHFPFKAICTEKRAISPLQIQDTIEVIGMASEDECAREIFVLTTWENETLAVPLSQLQTGSNIDERTQQALIDWYYWVKMGYVF